jgi:hypothetical protein
LHKNFRANLDDDYSKAGRNVKWAPALICFPLLFSGARSALLRGRSFSPPFGGSESPSKSTGKPVSAKSPFGIRIRNEKDMRFENLYFIHH